MSISAQTVFELRTAGNDGNGGGFVPGAVGTDYSTQNAAQYSGTDLVVDATLNTKVTSATHPFISSDVGNLMQITAGTGFTTGFYQIVGISAGTATLDRSPAAVTTAGGSYAVGGALATFAKLATAMVASNRAYVKADGTYATTATNTFAQNCSPSPTVPPSQIIGYTSTRGDGGMATIQITSGTSLKGLSMTGNGWVIMNILVDCNGTAFSTGISVASSYLLYNCKTTGSLTNGIFATSNGHVIACEAAASGGSGINSSGTSVRYCYVHGTGTGSVGAINGNVADVSFNVVANFSGATSDGIFNGTQTTVIANNTVYNCGRHGISGTSIQFPVCVNNVLVNNAGSGIKMFSATGNPAQPWYDGNAFWNNTAGARSFADDTGTTNAQDAVAPYTNSRDVTLTGDPFVNAAGLDFRLNSTAGAGAACRGSGVARSFMGLSPLAYPDMGALPHQDSGAGGVLYIPGLDGV